MGTNPFRNISLRKYIKFLSEIGLKNHRTSGGHLHYCRNDLDRPITLQSHIDPVPEFIVKQHLRLLSISKEEFIKIMNDL